MTDIHPGSFWNRKRDGREVKVEPMEDHHQKSFHDANWFDAVVFRWTDEEDSSGTYGLTRDDFLAEFEVVP